MFSFTASRGAYCCFPRRHFLVPWCRFLLSMVSLSARFDFLIPMGSFPAVKMSFSAPHGVIPSSHDFFPCSLKCLFLLPRVSFSVPIMSFGTCHGGKSCFFVVLSLLSKVSFPASCSLFSRLPRCSFLPSLVPFSPSHESCSKAAVPQNEILSDCEHT